MTLLCKLDESPRSIHLLSNPPSNLPTMILNTSEGAMISKGNVDSSTPSCQNLWVPITQTRASRAFLRANVEEIRWISVEKHRTYTVLITGLVSSTNNNNNKSIQMKHYLRPEWEEADKPRTHFRTPNFVVGNVHTAGPYLLLVDSKEKTCHACLLTEDVIIHSVTPNQPLHLQPFTPNKETSDKLCASIAISSRTGTENIDAQLFVSWLTMVTSAQPKDTKPMKRTRTGHSRKETNDTNSKPQLIVSFARATPSSFQKEWTSRDLSPHLSALNISEESFFELHVSPDGRFVVVYCFTDAERSILLLTSNGHVIRDITHLFCKVQGEMRQLSFVQDPRALDDNAKLLSTLVALVVCEGDKCPTSLELCFVDVSSINNSPLHVPMDIPPNVLRKESSLLMQSTILSEASTNVFCIVAIDRQVVTNRFDIKTNTANLTEKNSFDDDKVDQTETMDTLSKPNSPISLLEMLQMQEGSLVHGNAFEHTENVQEALTRTLQRIRDEYSSNGSPSTAQTNLEVDSIFIRPPTTDNRFEHLVLTQLQSVDNVSDYFQSVRDLQRVTLIYALLYQSSLNNMNACELVKVLAQILDSALYHTSEPIGSTSDALTLLDGHPVLSESALLRLYSHIYVILLHSISTKQFDITGLLLEMLNGLAISFIDLFLKRIPDIMQRVAYLSHNFAGWSQQKANHRLGELSTVCGPTFEATKQPMHISYKAHSISSLSTDRTDSRIINL